MPPPARRDRGMTLIEVLVVVFIMGLVSGVAVLSLPERPGPQERAMRDVRQLLEGVHDRAILTGEVTGLEVTDTGFRVLSWTGQEWMPVRTTALDLPRGVHLEVVADDPRARSRRSGELDRIIFNPLGIAEPVRLALTYRARSWQFELTPEGDVVDVQKG
ncbi:prepilin-type N-terminal cleavage/methylation domain-containing protein [Henriciella litoralis]|uniref:prepilin-type N-terminal cleavage/methylation domain-containing protein n=1 Tax=Henriciella litoralis TaxID=568102 RepID=UPI003898E33B